MSNKGCRLVHINKYLNYLYDKHVFGRVTLPHRCMVCKRDTHQCMMQTFIVLKYTCHGSTAKGCVFKHYFQFALL